MLPFCDLISYDIPDKVRYKEKIIFNLDGKQLVYALIFGVIALLAYNLPISGDARFIAPISIIIIGVGFTFLKLEDRISAQYSYFWALRLQENMQKFADKVIQIRDIRKDTIFLSNKHLRAVLQITPLNYSLFDEDRKKALIANYRDFLNHLNYPIQIIVRTKRASLEEYYAQYETAEGSLKGKLKVLYDDFKNHEINFLAENKVNEREYYLVICLFPESNIIKESIDRLNERVQIAQEKLLDCGIESRRLENKELMPFAVSYFNEVEHAKKRGKKRKPGQKKAKRKRAKAKKRKKAR